MDLRKNNKKKIMFVLIGSYPLFNPKTNFTYGGAEIDTYNIAKYINKEQFDVSFVVGDFGQKDKEIIDGVKIIKWAKIKNNNIFVSFFYLIKLFFIILKENPDIIFSKGVSWLTLELIFIGKIIGKKIIIKSSHLRNIDGSLNCTIHGKIFSKIINWVDVFILQNIEDIEIFKKNYTKYIKKIEVIRNFQDIPILTPRFLNKSILWIGRSEKFKRPEIFLKLAKMVPEYDFTIIIRNTNKNIFLELKNEAEKIKNITFIPGIVGEKIRKHYLNSSFLINTSENEGFPNVILEAMKHGTPIISFIDFDKIIEKNNCGKVSSNPEDISEFIKKISPDQWKELSNNCYKFAKENFNAEEGVIKYEKIIKDFK